MPQSPLLTDQVQVEPGTTTFGTRLIDRDTADGGLRFSDPNVTASLKDLVGLRNVTGVFLVGRAGGGAEYTSIQDALDAVPSSSSSSAPSLIWIQPGVYQENLTLQKDGVVMASPGGVTLQNSGASDTLEISAAISTTPQKVELRNLRIENDQDAQACIRVIGADTFATGTATVTAAPLSVGDTLTLSGNVLTGVLSTRTSGADDFSVSGGTPDAVAAEIAAAINDVANSFAATVEATVAGAIITLTAVTAGSGGNAITLATSTADITLSGGTLTGGGAAGSNVLVEGLLGEGLELVATGNTGYQVRADTSNEMTFRGGSWRGSSSTSEANITNCAVFRLANIEWVNNLQLSYDDGNDQPATATSTYEVLGVLRAGDSTVNLNNVGSYAVKNCPEAGDVTQGGTQVLSAVRSSLGDLTLSDTVAAVLEQCTRGAATDGGGTPTLRESTLRATLAFAASTNESYVFDIPKPSADYAVLLESPVTTATLGVGSKAGSGFDVDASGAITATVGVYIIENL